MTGCRSSCQSNSTRRCRWRNKSPELKKPAGRLRGVRTYLLALLTCVSHWCTPLLGENNHRTLVECSLDSLLEEHRDRGGRAWAVLNEDTRIGVCSPPRSFGPAEDFCPRNSLAPGQRKYFKCEHGWITSFLFKTEQKRIPCATCVWRRGGGKTTENQQNQADSVDFAHTGRRNPRQTLP